MLFEDISLLHIHELIMSTGHKHLITNSLNQADKIEVTRTDSAVHIRVDLIAWSKVFCQAIYFSEGQREREVQKYRQKESQSLVHSATPTTAMTHHPKISSKQLNTCLLNGWPGSRYWNHQLPPHLTFPPECREQAAGFRDGRAFWHNTFLCNVSGNVSRVLTAGEFTQLNYKTSRWHKYSSTRCDRDC